MKIRVGKDERYPCFYISKETYDPEIEITEEEHKRILLTEAAYDEAQKILQRAEFKKRG